MKKNAFVLVHDFGHPKSTILPVIKQMFDPEKWNICAMDRLDQVVDMVNAPDLIVTFKNAIGELPEDYANWYDDPNTYKWPEFVNEQGASFLVVHAGFAYIPDEHPVITDIVKAKFRGHPPMSELRFEPVENTGHPMMEGVTPFVSQLDEHFQVEGLSEKDTNILAWSYSDNGGKMPTVWAHECGKGRAAVILPGHANPTFEALKHPSMIRLLKNTVNWLGRFDEE